MNKQWNILYKEIDAKTVAAIESAAAVSPLLALLLAVRGVSPNDAAAFLSSSLSLLHDPFLLQDMDKAVGRITAALSKKERITIYGDYDVDGISAVAILLSYLRSVGADCAFYIPDRDTEGYGINEDAVRKIAKDGTKLIISVDTGITAIAETDLATSLGVDMIITDHHSVGDTLPAATAVINPKRADCNYPFPLLAGTGVAFKLVCALCGDTRKMVMDYCDIVALATIADVVPLSGENRVLTALGIRKMRKMVSPGLAALFAVSGLSTETITAEEISFYAAPRLNAAGRMGSCLPAVQLLLTGSAEEAESIAADLNRQNAVRKAIGEEIYKEALLEIEKEHLENDRVLVLSGAGWHHGIIGIIASRLTERFFRPTILISTDEDTGKGSGRSIPGFDLYSALQNVAPFLTRYGGHALAAGLTLPVPEIANLRNALNAYAKDTLSDADLSPTLDIDAPLDLSLPLLSVAEQLELLEPFGAGNEKPVFLLGGITISSVRTSKDKKHLFLRLFKNGAAVDAVAFGKGTLAETIARGQTADVAGKLHINTYGGTRAAQIIIEDIHLK